MPVKRRIAKLRDDYPTPSEARPVTLERWQRHRERMMAHMRPGRRPEEWWQYEAPISWPGYDNETVALYEAGLLSDEEIAELMPRWRAEFERAQAPNFFYVEGPGVYFEGAVARRRHYEWAQIPPSVLRAFEAKASGRKAVA